MAPLPALTAAQCREVDRCANEEYGVPGIVLMENAGRGVAEKIVELDLPGPVAICCGKGNNAGDGFVIARHLELHGVQARVLIWADPDASSGDAATNYGILKAADTPIEVFGPDTPPDQIDASLQGAGTLVDALLGTGARGEPRPPLDAAIDRMNATGLPVVAVDLPSGLDCDTGVASSHTIRATHTCTFVAPKPGLVLAEAEPFVGQLHVISIGAPRACVETIMRRVI